MAYLGFIGVLKVQTKETSWVKCFLIFLPESSGFEEMPTYKIRGIDVDFPYGAYDSQLVYMDKVIQSLQEVMI